MEKFRIAQYGFAQVTAIVYAILASGAAVRYNRPLAEMGFKMRDSYYWAELVRNYGLWLFLLVVIWAFALGYSTFWRHYESDEEDISSSGIALTAVYLLAGTFIAFNAAMPPADLILPVLKQ